MTNRERVYELLAKNPYEQAKIIAKAVDMPYGTACLYVQDWKRENNFKKKPTIRDISHEGFRQGKSVNDIIEATGASRSTVASYHIVWKKSTGEFNHMTDAVIAKELNITKEEVKEAYNSALIKMKEYLNNNKIDDFNDFNDLYYIQAYISERLESN